MADHINTTQRRFAPLLPASAWIHTPPVAASVSRRSKTLVACEEYRVRKSKCDAAHPCGACTLRSTTCLFAETKTRQSRQQAQVSDELLELMKSVPEHDAIDILRRVRRGTSHDDVLSQIADGNLRMQLCLTPQIRRRYDFPYISVMPAFLITPDNPYLHSPIYESTLGPRQLAQESAYTMPFHAAELCDPLIDGINLLTWTTVTSDNGLLRRLLKSFFLCAYIEWFPFHKDLFLSDMANNMTNFCSSLLVNAVMAYACYTYTRLPDRANYWLPDTLTYKFTAETKRLWEMESVAGKSRLTTIQASQILRIITDYNAIDKIGAAYAIQGLGMAQDLNLFKSCREIRSESMRKARIWTAWSLYASQAATTYSFHQLPFLTDVPEDPLPDDPAWYGEIYVRYPLSGTQLPLQVNLYVKAKCQLRVIINALSLQAFGSASGLSLEQTISFKRRLDNWFHALPKSLAPNNIMLPHHIVLHLEHHATIADLFLPHVLADSETRPSSIQQSLEKTLVHANMQMETLMRLYYLRHNFEAFDPCLTVSIVRHFGACITSLNASPATALQLRLPSEETLRSSLVLYASGLRTQARNYHFCTLIYFGLQSLIRPADLQFLLRFITPPTAAEMPPRMPHPITSWPLPIVRLNEDPKKGALNRLVGLYERMMKDSGLELPMGSSEDGIADGGI